MMRIYVDRNVGILTMGNATAYDHGSVAEVGRSIGPRDSTLA